MPVVELPVGIEECRPSNRAQLLARIALEHNTLGSSVEIEADIASSLLGGRNGKLSRERHAGVEEEPVCGGSLAAIAAAVAEHDSGRATGRDEAAQVGLARGAPSFAVDAHRES